MGDCGNCELCTFTVERLETYYFDSHATDVARPGWEDDPENLVDGSSVSFAATWINNRIQWLDENTATLQSNSDKPIIKVEIRAYSGTGIAGVLCGPLSQYLRPIFTAGQGDTYSFNPTYPPVTGTSTPNWSQWFNITTSTNAPGTWTWADVVALDLDTWMIRTICGDPNACFGYKVEIRITWTESVQMYFPRTIDGGLSKNIDIFNLWETMVKTRDSGLNSQPFRFSGVMMPICSILPGAILCFPLCFPLCFEAGTAVGEISAPTVFATIHEWIENHDEVTIACYGNCADGKYIIKDFATHSMRSPNYYKYDLILEKVED